MKRIKEFLDFLISVITIWKIIFPIILILVAVIGNLFEIGTQIIQLKLPLWIIVTISFLSLYPIVDLFVHLLTRRKITKELYGLLWKKPLLPFGYPQPYCPRENCGHKVLCRVVPPKPVHLMLSISDYNNIDLANHYYYECPIHDRLSGVPDEDIKVLQEKARLAMQK